MARIGGDWRRATGSGQQRHHPVGLDLEQALQHAAGLVGRQAAVEQQDPQIAVVSGQKVGAGHTGVVSNLRACDSMPAKHRRQLRCVGHTWVRMLLYRGMQSRDRPPRNARQPAGGQQGCSGAFEGLRFRAIGVDAVAGKLSVPLPLQAQAGTKGDAEWCGAARRRCNAVLLAKLNQMPKFVLALRTVDQHRHMRRTRRRLNRYRRAGVELMGQRQPLDMIGRQARHDMLRNVLSRLPQQRPQASPASRPRQADASPRDCRRRRAPPPHPGPPCERTRYTPRAPRRWSTACPGSCPRR